MNEQMRRLYLAAKELKGIDTQSGLAVLMGMSPQNVNNWELRGVSKQGMIKAQSIIGCRAEWIESGSGPMLLDSSAATISRLPSNVTPAYPTGYRRLPVVSWVSAACWSNTAAR